MSDKTETISYKPTQCSEPWDETEYFANPNLSREERFKLYLKNNGIVNLLEFKNTKDDNVNCTACNCPSSDTFSFKLSQTDYVKILTIEPFKTFFKK
ncbi:hypothetical protein EGI22_16650 [Lacihabitans sp. LS3-19]|nr:hypothetical protein [Lacihabitans sp. LS3-19]